MYKLSTFPLKNIICLLLTLTILTLAGTMGYTDEKEPDDLPVPFEPTHPKVVATMLELAKIQKNDIIIDPGCGDGRILIKAALKYGVKSVCMDISPQRILEAKEKAVDYGVENKIKFIVGDSLKQDFSKASVIMLYMLEDFNVQLRPIFFKQLKPGTRVVAHGFHMGDWEPDQEIYHKKARRRKIYYWVIPAQVQGKWKFNDITITGLNLKNIRLDIKQNFQKISGTVQISGEEKPLTMARLNGQKIELNWQGEVSGKKLKIEWNGIVHSDRIEGTQITTTGEGKPAASVAWKAVPEKSLAQKKEKENE